MNVKLTAKKYLGVAALVLLLLPLGAEAGFGKFFYDNVVMGLFGTLLGWCGLILNWSINTFVIGFGEQMRVGGQLNNVVTQSWETLRDLFNLTFIFGLVYIGFKMILRTDDGQTKRWLVNIIIAALLVNFSLFITKFVIDVSNITAVEIINLGQSSRIFTVTGNEINLSNDMQNVTKISSTGKDASGQEIKPEGNFAVIFGTMFLFIVTGFVYISAGILLIARGGILILLMIVSPFLFIGMVLPVFRNTSSKLWSTLFKRAFLAPIFIAILYISMSVAGAFTASQGSSGFAEALGGSNMTGQSGVAFGSYILIIMLLLSSLTIAQKLGAEGAGAVISGGKRLRQGAQRKIAGAGARGVNRAARAYQRSYDRAGNTRSGRMARRAASVMSLGVLSDKNISKARNMRVRGEETLDDKERRGDQITARASSQRREDQRATDRNSDNSLTRANAYQNMSNEELGRLSQREREANAQYISPASIRSLEAEGKIRADQADTLLEGRENAIFEDIQRTFSTAESSAAEIENAFARIAREVGNIPDDRLAQQGRRLDDANFVRHLSDDQMGVLRQQLEPGRYDEVRQARETAQIEFASTGRAAGVAENFYNTNEANQVSDRNRRRLFNNATQAGQLPAAVFRDPRNRELLTTRAVEERIRNGVNENDLYGNPDDENDIGIAQNIQAYIDGTDEPNLDPAVQQRRARTWGQWSNRSDHAGALGLQINQGNNGQPNQQEQQGGPQIATDTDVAGAARDRDQNNNT